MNYTFIITGTALLISFFINREKTLKALKIVFWKFAMLIPAFLIMLILVSVVLYLVPDKVISHYLGSENKFSGFIFASFFGSITIMPGFIAFPLCGILLKKSVPYMVLSALTTTLMMVGVLTYPIEKEYFGIKVTLIRNIMSFLIAIIVALTTGIFFGEVF